jgi:hypothetical protein
MSKMPPAAIAYPKVISMVMIFENSKSMGQPAD